MGRDQERVHRRGAVDVLVATVALALLLAWPLHVPPIWTRGEAREGLIVRNIVEHGNWIIAYREGVLASKPPFFHWIAAGVAHVVGVTDAVVRLPSALGACAMLAATMVLGHAIGGAQVAWLAAGVLAATLLFWRSALEARVDMVFAAAITIQLVAFFLRNRRATLASGLVCMIAGAAAVLSKGPAGLLLPFMAMLGYLAAERRLAQLPSLAGWPLAGSVLIAGPWYLAAYHAAGTKFLEVQVVHENVDRLLGTGAFHRRLARSLRLPAALATQLFPWNLALVTGAWRRWHGEREDTTGHFLHAWWMAVVAVLAMTSRTRSVYLLPALPAIALLAARALVRVRGRWPVPTLATLALIAFGATLASRYAAAAADPLVALADRVRPRLRETTTLRASLALLENDPLVLRYLLHRSIPRGPIACEPELLVFAPASARERAAQLGLHVADEAGAGSRAIMLLDCPAKPG